MKARCPHGVSQRNGGWTFDRPSRLWVHGDPECGLPKHHTTQEISVIRTPARWRNPLDPKAAVMLCIDPGDVHVGLAFFHLDPGTPTGLVCHYACEKPPDRAVDLLARLSFQGFLHTVVFERFRLYADLAAEQKGSEFETSQMIGVIKWICRQQNDHAEQHLKAAQTVSPLACMVGGACKPETRPQTITVVGQFADIKKPTAGHCRTLGIKSYARAHRDEIHVGGKTCDPGHCHAVDAELHGWRWWLRGRLQVEENPRNRLRERQALE